MQQSLELGEIARRKQRQVLGDHRERLGAAWRRFGQRLELQRQAFGGVARAHTRGLEALQVTERDRQLVGLDLELRRKHLGELFERCMQITILVERVDQRTDEPTVAQRNAQHGELRQQMIAQRARRDLLRVEAFVVVVGVAAAAPVGLAAGIILEVGALGRLRTFACLGVLVLRTLLVAGRRLGRRRRIDARELRGGRQRLVVAFDLFEQRIFLQHPLDLGVQLDRRELQQTDRLLKLGRQRQVLRELELEGLLH